MSLIFCSLSLCIAYRILFPLQFKYQKREFGCIFSTSCKAVVKPWSDKVEFFIRYRALNHQLSYFKKVPHIRMNVYKGLDNNYACFLLRYFSNRINPATSTPNPINIKLYCGVAVLGTTAPSFPSDSRFCLVVLTIFSLYAFTFTTSFVPFSITKGIGVSSSLYPLGASVSINWYVPGFK